MGLTAGADEVREVMAGARAKKDRVIALLKAAAARL